MTDEYRFLDPVNTSLSGWTGDVEDTHDNPYESTGDWLSPEDADDGGDAEINGQFNPPSGALSGEQEFQVRVRCTDNGNGDGAVLEVTVNGDTAVDTIVDSGDTEVIDGLTYQPNELQDPPTIDIYTEDEGGMPGGRDMVEVGAVRWAVSLDQTFQVQTANPSDISTLDALLNGEITFAGYEDEGSVWFEWRETDGTWSETTEQTVTTADDSYDELIDNLSEDTEYEFFAAGDHPEAGYDEGDTVSFYTNFLIGGTVELNGSGVEGAVMEIIDEDSVITETTDSNGDFQVEVSGGTDYHVATKYEDNGTFYRAESEPEVRP